MHTKITKTEFTSTKVIPLGSTAFRQPFATSHCKFLHGYRLQAKFWFGCNELDNNNWVVDFGALKELKKELENIFDHTTCISTNDPDLEIFKNLHEKGIIDLRLFHDGVGIEKFAKFCHMIADRHVRKMTSDRAWCKKVEVWEHESNSATYEEISFTNVSGPVPEIVEEPKLNNPYTIPPQTTTTPPTPAPQNVPPLYGTKTTGMGNLFAGTSWAKK